MTCFFLFTIRESIPACFADAVKDKVMYEAYINIIGSDFIPFVSRSWSRRMDGKEVSLQVDHAGAPHRILNYHVCMDQLACYSYSSTIIFAVWTAHKPGLNLNDHKIALYLTSILLLFNQFFYLFILLFRFFCLS